jgi:hypothetical protein
MVGPAEREANSRNKESNTDNSFASSEKIIQSDTTEQTRRKMEIENRRVRTFAELGFELCGEFGLIGRRCQPLQCWR